MTWRSNLSRVVSVVAVVGMLVVIVTRAMADPPTTPREADREQALRVLDAPGELRTERPSGTWIAGLGIVEPATPERELAPGMAGRVAMIAVKEGDFVPAGTLLVELESVAERAAVAASEAEVATFELELQKLRGGVRKQDINALRQDAEAARTRAHLSQSTYERTMETQGAGGLSAEALERAAAQAQQEEAQAQAAEARLESSLNALPLDVRLAQARLDGAQGRLAQAEAALVMRQVTAPADGEVLEILPEVGEYVTPGGAAIVVMGDTRKLRARIDIDERDVARLQDGAPAIITVDALPGREFAGTVQTIARRMGRKNVRTNEPTERVDVKILEVVVELDATDALIIGQRVTGYLRPIDAD